MANDGNTLRRARDFLETRVIPWWQEVVCKLAPAQAISLLLTAIYLQLREMGEQQQFGGTYLRITPYALVANGAAVKVLEKESQGRLRKVSIWVDAATGGPLPTLRISTGATSAAGGGLRVLPGSPNELGEVPFATELWASSTAAVTLYVIERA